MKSLSLTLLQVDQISVGYGEPIVFDASFHVTSGQLTALVGPNGCGKSTLLKCMGRILKPNTGRVLLNQQTLHELSTRQVAQQLALLPQSPFAPEGLTVRELVAQGRFPHQSLFRQWSREDEAAVEEAMMMTDTLSLAERSIDELSGGQRQRCWIAMVLAQQTPLILLDEPTNFLDLRVQVDLLNLLASLAHQHGRNVVVVLHELNLAAAFADQMIMMHAGRIHAQGSPEAVLTVENLQTVFKLDAHILQDPNSGRLLCVPKQVPATKSAANKVKSVDQLIAVSP